MKIVFYNSLVQKKEAIIAAHLRQESKIHDDFVDISGNLTDGTKGRLTFGRIPDPVPRRRKGLNELNRLLKDKRLKYPDLLDLLEIQALKLNSTRWENFKALFGG